VRHIALALALALPFGCASGPPTAIGLQLAVDDPVIWTAGVDDATARRAAEAARIITRQAGLDDPGCVAVRAVRAPMPWPSRGILLADDVCRAPHASIHPSERWGIADLCSQRITGRWPHAIRPQVYLIASLVTRALGLRSSTATPWRASLTSRGHHVMRAAKGLPFALRRGEIRELRRRYCGRAPNR